MLPCRVEVEKYLLILLFLYFNQCYFSRVDGGQVDRMAKCRALKTKLGLSVTFATY